MPDSARSTPIEDHGVIGDMRTAALVSREGCIDFMCAPEFDSPTLFARLLDADAGHFGIAPDGNGLRVTQRYLPDTNVLVTRFMSADGIAELTDFMTIGDVDAPQCLVRTVRVLRGSFRFEAACMPRFGYAAGGHRLEAQARGGVFHPEDGPATALRATVPMTARDGDLFASFPLEQGEEATFVLQWPASGDAPLDPDAVVRSFRHTVAWWHDWIGGARYAGRWREVVTRSALLLKLMTSARHGAMVAAVTFGLPERIGGEKNWDYRYCWVRDTSFAMYAFVRLGLVEEMERFVGWISGRVQECAEAASGWPLRIMYRLDGGTDLAERSLEHLAGWNGSRPVRVGNAAADQFQLDIYGELADALYLANKYGHGSSYEGWKHVRQVVEYVRANWQRPDRGIWETRGEERTFLYSRLMCWVALDRAIRLAQKRSYPAPLPEWNQTRLEIHASIHEEFWDEALGSFVVYPGAGTVDGAMLLMPLLRFISATDPRWLSTMKRIGDELSVDALVFRTPPGPAAGPGEPEGAFLACSFWYVEALARSGDIAQARLLFDKLLGYANHVGLYAEELSFHGAQLGNFPQVLTHLALISAATYLDRRLSEGMQGAWS